MVFAPFLTIRRRLDRACLAVGTRFCGGFGFSDDEIGGILAEVKKLVDQFNAAKTNLLSIWPQPVEDWIAQHPSEEAEIRRIAPDVIDLDRALRFTVQTFKVDNQSSMLAAVGIQDGVASQISGMCWQVAREIAQDVQDTWRPAADNSVSQKIKNSLVRWRKKAQALTFIDSRLNSIVNAIDGVIDVLPPHGRIEGQDFLVLNGLMSLLSNPNNVVIGNMSVTINEATEAESAELDGDDFGLEASHVNDEILGAIVVPSQPEQAKSYAW
jgi:hypothetical protein